MYEFLAFVHPLRVQFIHFKKGQSEQTYMTSEVFKEKQMNIWQQKLKNEQKCQVGVFVHVWALFLYFIVVNAWQNPKTNKKKKKKPLWVNNKHNLKT